MIVAIVLIVLLVVGGGGVALVVLNKDDDKNNASTTDTEETSPSESESGPTSEGDTPPSDEEETPADEEDDTGGGDASNTPEDVRQAYMDAYESKSFSDVVKDACEAYKNEYGTDTSELEQQLADYQITATAKDEPEVTGTTATAKIDLELSQAGNTQPASIFIKIVEEAGEWRFCGEGEA
jgi:hypothetical protein